MGSIPSTKKPDRNNQCTGQISRQLWVNSPTLSTGSSLSPSLAQPFDADLLLVWPLLLLPSPRRGHGLFGDCWLHNWLQLLRPSRLTWIAKREAVQLPSRLQFIHRLGRPGLRNAKLLGFPPGCSFLDRKHDLREILIRHQIHSTNNKFWE